MDRRVRSTREYGEGRNRSPSTLGAGSRVRSDTGIQDTENTRYTGIQENRERSVYRNREHSVYRKPGSRERSTRVSRVHSARELRERSECRCRVKRPTGCSGLARRRIYTRGPPTQPGPRGSPTTRLTRAHGVTRARPVCE